MRHTLAMALAVLLVGAGPAVAQEEEGTFIDGELVEGYVYVPDFMAPEELKRRIEAGDAGVVVVDTAAPLIFEEEHISGSVNYPWVHELELPVTLPRDRTLVVYCACNDHEDSKDMAQKLSLVGYLDVKVLEGGWFRWLDLDYPVAGSAVDEEAQ